MDSVLLKTVLAVPSVPASQPWWTSRADLRKPASKMHACPGRNQGLVPGTQGQGTEKGSEPFYHSQGGMAGRGTRCLGELSLGKGRGPD